MEKEIEEILFKYGITRHPKLCEALTNFFYEKSLNLDALTSAEKDACNFFFFIYFKDDAILVKLNDFASEYKVSKAVLSSGLKKLEAAGAIKFVSAGAKGVYIKVLNKLLRQKLAKK